MHVRLFGGIRASSGGVDLDLGGPKQRLIFALLVIDIGRVVTLDRLVDAVWGGDPPDRAAVSVRGYISNLRKVLSLHCEDVTLQWRDLGYVVSGPLDVDVHDFERLVESGRRNMIERDDDAAKRALADAVALWSGPVLGAYADAVGLDEIVGRWDELRSEAIERLFDVRLAMGEHRELAADLRVAIADYPFSEHLRVQLAIALYRAGRPVEALRSLQAARRTLIEEVGVEPGQELREVESRIHAKDPSLDWIEPSAPSGRPRVDIDARQLRGRSGEMSVLQAALAEVRGAPTPTARGRAVIVGGDPGIGKTALVEQLSDRARDAGFIVAWARCRESATGAPYWPWTRLAGELAATAGGADAGARLETALSPDNDVDEVTVDGSAARLIMHSAARDALAHLAAPALLVVDDLHWADAASLSLLDFIASELAGLRVVMAVTVRTSRQNPLLSDCLAEMSRSAGSTRLQLQGLDLAAVSDWIVADLGADASDDVAAVVHGRTEGNPFFVREVVALLSSGDGGQRVEEVAAGSVPLAVHDVVRRRTSRLAAETQRLLVVAAVIGREFDTELLAAVTAMSHDHVLTGLEPALEAGLVGFDPGRPGVARFSHALVADALSAELNAVRRARLHDDVARALERRWSGNPDAGLVQLAFHAFGGATAGSASSSVDYSMRAARLASDAHTPADAVEHLERALAVLDLVDPSEVRRRVEILTELGIARCAASDVSSGRSSLLAAAKLAESVGDMSAVVRALAHVNADDLWTSLDWGQHDRHTIALIEHTLDRLPADEASGRAGLLAALAGQTYHVDPQRSRRAAAQAVDSAASVDDPILRFRVLLLQYWAEWRPSGHGVRAAVADRMLDIVAQHELPRHLEPLAHLARFTVAFELGDATLSERHHRLARAAADPILTPAAWSYTLYAQVSLELLRGQLEQAADTIDALDVALRRSRRFVAATTRAGLRLQLRVEQGRTDDALAEIAELDTSVYGSSISWFKAWALAEGGRIRDVDRALAAHTGSVADDWLKTPLLTAGITAAAASGNTGFLREHIDELRPMSNMLACTGSGGIVLGPVALALARACRTLGDEVGSATYSATASSLIERMDAAPWRNRARHFEGLQPATPRR